MDVWYVFFILFVQSIVLYILSKTSIQRLYGFMYQLSKSKAIANYVIILLFFPGTIIHELSHYIVALLLMLNARSFVIFPQVEKNHILLGSVTYEKKDPVRGFLVGIAPFFGVCIMFFIISKLPIMQSDNLYIRIGIGHLIFSLSSQMFSSQQDIIDALAFIPIISVVFIVFYIFSPVHITQLIIYLVPSIRTLFPILFFYLNLSICIHAGIVIIVTILNRLFTRAL